MITSSKTGNKSKFRISVRCVDGSVYSHIFFTSEIDTIVDDNGHLIININTELPCGDGASHMHHAKSIGFAPGTWLNFDIEELDKIHEVSAAE
jgi:hypothetical protein